MAKETPQQAKHKAIERAKRDRRIFCHDSSKADMRIIKNGIIAWIKDPNPNKKTWHQVIMDLVWDRNNGGRDLKYVYFNEKLQRVFLDRDFEAWAKETTTAIHTALCQLQQTY